MLKAIAHNTAGTIKLPATFETRPEAGSAATRNGQTLRWRDLFGFNEDLLTSAVVARLTYLPGNVLCGLLQESSNQLREWLQNPGDLTAVEFWPRLDKPAGTTGDSDQTVIPDVLLHFENRLVIIEAKRFDTTPQSREQWRKEIEAVDDRRCVGGSDSPLLLALGGCTDNTALLPDDPIIPLTWRALQAAVTQYINDDTRLPYHVHRLLRDLSLALELGGYPPPLWLAELSSDLEACGLTIDLQEITLPCRQINRPTGKA